MKATAAMLRGRAEGEWKG